MKRVIVISVALTFVVSVAYAADEKKLTPQQEKMKACNALGHREGLEGRCPQSLHERLPKGGQAHDAAGEDDGM
jgi:hypothetical protein